MATETREFEGLKIWEAIRRYGDRDLFKECIANWREWIANGGRTHFRPRDIRREPWMMRHNQEEYAKKLDL
jgi:hypothetical protein